MPGCLFHNMSNPLDYLFRASTSCVNIFDTYGEGIQYRCIQILPWRPGHACLVGRQQWSLGRWSHFHCLISIGCQNLDKGTSYSLANRTFSFPTILQSGGPSPFFCSQKRYNMLLCRIVRMIKQLTNHGLFVCTFANLKRMVICTIFFCFLDYECLSVFWPIKAPSDKHARPIFIVFVKFI